MQTETESARKIERGDVVIRTRGRDRGKIGVVGFVCRAADYDYLDPQVRVTWVTKRHVVPRIYEGPRFAAIKRGARYTGTAKPSTLEGYGLRRLPEEVVEHLGERFDEIERDDDLSFSDRWEARREAREEAIERSEPLDLR